MTGEELRFSRRYERTEDGCWEWLAAKDQKGYGQFYADGRTYRAHRYAYATHRGTIPHGMMVLHSCDNPSCVNPDHLRVGTHRDNMRDMVKRGRSPVGARHPRTEFTASDVRRIRARRRSGESYAAIAKAEGSNKSTIRLICVGETWTHITNGEAVEPTQRVQGALSDEDVRSIRRAAKRGESQKSIGERFGLSQSMVSRIVNRHRYADVETNDG